MKTKKDIERILAKNKPVLQKRFHVEKIGIFGSYARGNQTEDSDIDILVTFSSPIGWEFVDLKEYLEEILGKPIDLVTIPALKPRMKDTILQEVVYA